VTLLTMGQAAKMLGTTVPTLREWGKRGVIKTVRSGGGHRKIPAEEVKRMTGKAEKPPGKAMQVYNFAFHMSADIGDNYRSSESSLALLTVSAIHALKPCRGTCNEVNISLVDDKWIMWKWYQEEVERDVCLVAVDRWDRPSKIVKWTFRNAEPIEYMWPGLDASCTETLVSEATLSFQTFDFEVIK